MDEYDRLYKNPNEPIEARLKDLLSRMTLKEKIAQMTQIERRVATSSALKDLNIGSVFSAPNNGPFEKALLSDWADMVDDYQKLALESRLGIPIIYGIDAVHGNNSVYGATIFPHNVGLGATRNNVIACAKHFVGDGGTEKGVNEGNTVLSYEDLERIHLVPYVYCIEHRVSTIMVSYSSWNGNKLHGHHFLLTEILKGKLGFKGFVISDWEGIDELCQPYGSDYRHCISTAINAGIDMVMVLFRYELFMEELAFLVQSGEIPIARIDDAVERILRVKFAAKLFEFPLTDKSLLDIVGCKPHRNLAREAVRKSLVLLKNGKNPSKPFLPLSKHAKRILVSGTHANDIGYQCGGWTGSKYGSSGQIAIGTTILDAIKEAVGGKTEVIYEQYPSIEIIERHEFPFAIVVVGEAPYAEGRGDNSELTIPFNGSRIINLVADKVPTLVILISGRPLVIESCLLEKIDALVAAWLPGTEGQGITDVIFGDHEFKGQLPMTWFRRVEQLDQLVDHGVKSYDPLFPLGYGLAYNKENLYD
ncbi:uncharacterized protein LOC107609749 isoform X3 [Arachis ipaensis]|uniref:uncharacterized protein LOC107609749 isoform X3 n=1 Tax=Arachis ipaensis TaxID=130454 RepID=UPI000A2B903C|nr:uncharacterized protein LOC107609749 isoform X3 [Arachis ipaensis]XP_025666880.1 uncharacterized protein LOC112765206 isoform X3 [Arachis hypogaea]QHN92330.1 Beta-glucosidase BoGH3B [Arachis hypogaea]